MSAKELVAAGHVCRGGLEACTYLWLGVEFQEIENSLSPVQL